MTPILQEQASQQSQFLSLSDKYEEYRNDVSWGNHRGRNAGKKGKMATPSSSKAVMVTREPFKEVLADPKQLLQVMTPPTSKIAPPIFQEHYIGNDDFPTFSEATTSSRAIDRHK